MANADTLEDASAVANDYRDRADYAIVVPCAAFFDFSEVGAKHSDWGMDDPA